MCHHRIRIAEKLQSRRSIRGNPTRNVWVHPAAATGLNPACSFRGYRANQLPSPAVELTVRGARLGPRGSAPIKSHLGASQGLPYSDKNTLSPSRERIPLAWAGGMP